MWSRGTTCFLSSYSHAVACPQHSRFTETLYHLYFLWSILLEYRSQWPRGLRSRSTAARLLRSWVRIPPESWISACCECCVLSGRGLCDELITRPEKSYRLSCVVVCDLETSRMRKPWPALGRSATGKKYCSNSFGSFLALRMYHMGCAVLQCCSWLPKFRRNMHRVSNEDFLTDWQRVEICCLLECYVAYSGNSLPTIRQNWSFPKRR